MGLDKLMTPELEDWERVEASMARVHLWSDYALTSWCGISDRRGNVVGATGLVDCRYCLREEVRSGIGKSSRTLAGRRLKELGEDPLP